jgi:hypothetical protein
VKKRDELATPTSCINSALDDEWVFVLIGRDASAPYAIRAWCEHRVTTGKNKYSDEIIVEALACAQRMVDERSEVRAKLGKSDGC